jgi:hypothetical protein
MEPLTNDETSQDEEETQSQSDAGVVTGPAPYDATDDEDWED